MSNKESNRRKVQSETAVAEKQVAVEVKRMEAFPTGSDEAVAEKQVAAAVKIIPGIKNAETSNGTGKAEQKIPNDCIILSAGKTIVLGRGLQVLGNNVRDAETKSSHRLQFDLMVKVLVDTNATDNQITQALTAAGMQPSGFAFGVSRANLKYLPKQFVPKA